MSLRENISYRLDAWGYLLFAGAASLVGAFKSFGYSHLLDGEQYALVNYYILIVGLGVLVVGSGVVVRCHTELPLIIKNEDKKHKLASFISNARSVGLVVWLILVVLLLPSLYLLTDISLWFIFLSLLQVLLFFLFFVDLMVEKSGGRFLLYAKKMFRRNFIIMLSGLVSALVWGEADLAVASEVFLNFFLCSQYFSSWVKSFRIPCGVYLNKSFEFVPVTILGACVQYSDRSFAAVFMSKEGFASYSFFSLIVMLGMSVQQLINTKVITLLPVMCEKNPREGFAYALKVSIIVFSVLFLILSLFLIFFRSGFLVAEWLDFSFGLGMLFVVLSSIRASDMFSGYLIVMGRKKVLVMFQSLTLFLVFLASLLHNYLYSQSGVFGYVVMVLCAFLMIFVSLVFYSWKVSFVRL